MSNNSNETEAEIRDIQWIQSILPHRYPFLLVDRVLSMDPESRIVALKNVTINEEFFVGHFPDHPVMPGVLLVEGMAQAGGLLLLSQVEDREKRVCYLASVEKARFRRPVRPGDQLIYEVEILRRRTTAARLSAKAKVDDLVVAEAVLSSVLVDR